MTVIVGGPTKTDALSSALNIASNLLSFHKIREQPDRRAQGMSAAGLQLKLWRSAGIGILADPREVGCSLGRAVGVSSCNIS